MTRKERCIMLIREARHCLAHNQMYTARVYLEMYREIYAAAPASTKRRWRCGQ